MAVSKINGKSIRVVSVTFTYVSYNLWYANTKDTHRILQSVNSDYGVIGDGTNYCALIMRNGTEASNAQFAPSANSPITMDCLAIPR